MSGIRSSGRLPFPQLTTIVRDRDEKKGIGGQEGRGGDAREGMEEEGRDSAEER